MGITLYDLHVAPRLEKAEAFQHVESPNPELDSAIQPSARHRNIGKSAVAALGITVAGMGLFVSCAREDGDSLFQGGFWQGNSQEEIGAVTADAASEWAGDLLGEESITVRPPEFDPTKYQPGEAIGAMVIDYADYDRDAELTDEDIKNCEAGKALTEDKMGACFWRERTAYFGDERASYPESVHAFTAGGWGVDEYLANGPVMYQPAEGDESMYVAMHNVTPIDQTINLNGNVYNQPMMGINDFMAKGTVLKYVVPSEKEGHMYEYTFERDGFRIVGDVKNDAATSEAIFGNNGDADLVVISCWVPGLSTHRFVYTYKKVGSEVVIGTVKSTGEVIVDKDAHIA